jgi:hypothetical protein
MFSNARTLYEQASSGNYQFDASGFRRQGSVLNRVGQNFMFTSPSQSSNSGFNLMDQVATPFEYIVKPSSVSNIFNSGIYRYKTPVNSIGSGTYVYPTEPNRSTPPSGNVGGSPPSG